MECLVCVDQTDLRMGTLERRMTKEISLHPDGYRCARPQIYFARLISGKELPDPSLCTGSFRPQPDRMKCNVMQGGK